MACCPWSEDDKTWLPMKYTFWQFYKTILIRDLRIWEIINLITSNAGIFSTRSSPTICISLENYNFCCCKLTKVDEWAIRISYFAAVAVESLAGGHAGSDKDQDFDDHLWAEVRQVATLFMLGLQNCLWVKLARQTLLEPFTRPLDILIMKYFLVTDTSQAENSRVLDKKFYFAFSSCICTLL